MRPTRVAPPLNPASNDVTEADLSACWHCRRLDFILCCMSDVTQILSQIERGDPQAADKLLPLVYDELRKLASAKLAQEKPGQTLQATALVHEAFMRLVDGAHATWNGRGHFFGAAAEAMRRILVEKARRKAALKAGGQAERCPLTDVVSIAGAKPQDRLELLALDEALCKLERQSPRKA